MPVSVVSIRRIVISASIQLCHEPVEPLPPEATEPPFAAEQPHHTRTYRVVASYEQPTGEGRRELLVTEAAERPDLGAVVAAVYRRRDIAAAGSEFGAVRKYLCFVNAELFRELCFGQVGAAAECGVADFGDAVGQGYACQRRAALKGFICDFGEPVGQGYACQRCTVLKRGFLDFSNAVGDSDVFQRAAVIESTFPNFGNTDWKRYICQLFAAMEGAATDIVDALWNGDALKRCAALKGIGIDFGDAVRNGDVCQRCAFTEGAIPDFGDTVRKGDACKRRTFGEGGELDLRGTAFDSGAAFMRVDAFQRLTSRKGKAADLSDADRQCDACQRIAVLESSVSDIGYAVRQTDALKSHTAHESVLHDFGDAVRNCDAFQSETALKSLDSDNIYATWYHDVGRRAVVLLKHSGADSEVGRAAVDIDHVGGDVVCGVVIVYRLFNYICRAAVRADRRFLCAVNLKGRSAARAFGSYQWHEFFLLLMMCVNIIDKMY